MNINEMTEKLGELEDVLEKYGIENAEELDSAINAIRTNTLIDMKNKEMLELENANLKNELAELKQKAIVSKFKIGDKVYAIVDAFADTGVLPVEIKGTHLLYKVWDGQDILMLYFARIFATKEEAKQKLAEIKGEKDE